MKGQAKSWSPWIALLLLVPLTGCATGQAILTGILNPVAAVRKKAEVCSEAVPKIVDGKTLEATFRLGARGGNCRSTFGMTFTRGLSELSRLSKKVNNLTVGDIVSLKSLSLGDGVNLLQKMTVTTHAKRPKEPRFVFEEAGVDSPPPDAFALPPRATAGSVRGLVTDQLGSPLADVWVALAGQFAVTGPDGWYMFGRVPPGAYETRTHAHGFEDGFFPSRDVPPGELTRWDIVLEVVAPQ